MTTSVFLNLTFAATIFVTVLGLLGRAIALQSQTGADATNAIPALRE